MAAVTVTLAVLGGCTPAEPGRTAQPTDAVAAASTPAFTPVATPTPGRTSRPTYPPLPRPTASPRPEPGTWLVDGLILHLGEGWWEIPDITTLTIIAALDEMGDPYAGVYNLVLKPMPGSPGGPSRFHSLGAGRPDAGLVFRRLATGMSAVEAAAASETALEAAGIPTTREPMDLPLGRGVALRYARDFPGGPLHVIAIFGRVDGGVFRIDFGTAAPATERQEAMLHAILASIRPDPHFVPEG